MGIVRRNSITDMTIESTEAVTLADKSRVQVHVVKGDLLSLPLGVQQYIAENVKTCEPKGIYICDGSEEERNEITEKMVARGVLTPLPKYDNCYLCRTDPADVARVEGKTFIVTKERYASVPHVAEGTKGILGQWMDPEQANKEIEARVVGCMKGRVMYVIPFSMGPVGGALSKIGVQLTDSNYVVLSMRVMTRLSSTIWPILANTEDYVKCFHSIGAPRPVTRKVVNHWPCDPERVLICHFPDERRIVSYGSGYGGNSLLGKKCFALRIAGSIARDEGWLAEHMLILSVTNPQGKERFIAAAFPSACGKTNMAMITSLMPGYTAKCVGDDIAWMRFDDDGQLRAINPEAGFFGVAPGTSMKTNPMAMRSCTKNTILTNVAMTDDGGFYWEGLEKEMEDPNVGITTWLGERFKIGDKTKAAHPNSRFCAPAANCPIIHPKWEDPAGVPIDAIIFGGRRPTGVPLIYESRNWKHGVMIGAALKSETTAAAEFKGKQIMHDPMAMRPFMGYNFGEYLQHWLNLETPERKMPKIFHANWFRLSEQGKFLWPGFGENMRVIDWICRRIEGEDIVDESPIGFLPKKGSINLTGMTEKVDMNELLSIPKDYWVEDIRETTQFLEAQTGSDLPKVIREELSKQQKLINNM